METSDGKDISALLFDEGNTVRDFSVTEFALSKSLRKGKYRYVHYTKDYFIEEYPEGYGELYDLETDPWEMRNLFFEKQYAEKVNELQADLMDWLLSSSRVKTVLGTPPLSGEQYVTRYGNTVALDGKINPDYIPRGARYS
jgi:arylsulfatase